MGVIGTIITLKKHVNDNHNNMILYNLDHLLAELTLNALFNPLYQ